MIYQCPICGTIHTLSCNEPLTCYYCNSDLKETSATYVEQVDEIIGMPFTSDFPNHSKNFPFADKKPVANIPQEPYTTRNDKTKGETKMIIGTPERHILTVEIEILTQSGVWTNEQLDEMVLDKIREEVNCDYLQIAKHQVFEGEICQEDEEEIVREKIAELDSKAEFKQQMAFRKAEVE